MGIAVDGIRRTSSVEILVLFILLVIITMSFCI